jgi:hypothetical protein
MEGNMEIKEIFIIVIGVLIILLVIAYGIALLMNPPYGDRY